ncbi:MAG: hypothetical protein CMO80_11790 [Verrucomicrobiales bacterium]|nr:hypothetical protein [Verrucomicrobiales bacterium]
MLHIAEKSSARNCAGFTRRTALKAGFLGALGLSTADLLRLEASGAAKRSNKSVILLWLDGGPSQFETYDPKAEAPAEYRGPFGDIPTNVPGIRFSELLPLQAKHADKMCVIRSVHHTTGDHFAGAHWMLTGRFGATSANKTQQYPSLGSTIAKAQGSCAPGMPAYIGLPAAESVYLYPGYQGAAYLGPSYEPFQVNMKQKYLSANYTAKLKPPPILANMEDTGGRASTRLKLLDQLDHFDRVTDKSGAMESMDRYQQEAVDMLLRGKARHAFDMEKEDPKVRDLYGRGPWGHYTLMARRIVESGARFVTVDMPHWDTHSRIQLGMEQRLPVLDKAVSGLLQDLHDRSMFDDVLVVIMGEFGRTPKMNSGQPGIPIPGRDHWGQAMSVILAGGGLPQGLTVGATNSKGEHPVESPYTPSDLLATIYHVLGIDLDTSFLDHSGRPIPILDGGKPMKELV